MSKIIQFVNAVMHFDKYLPAIVSTYGTAIYAFMFIIIFCETGLVFTPFLPGDSIIFASTAIAAMGSLNIMSLFLTFTVAAILGDTVNYWIGYKAGNKIVEKENSRFINKNHIIKAQNFYDEHGSITIVIGRFIPIVRTFVPFVAGIGKMNYAKFITYNIVGGIAWVSVFTIGGYFFGNLPFVKNNFSFFMIGIIVVSLMPVVIGFIKEYKASSKNK